MGATYKVQGLTQGRRYFFRVCCGNVKEWGKYRLSTPSNLTPSCKYFFLFYINLNVIN